jgi:large subunit ribosomal protein L49
MALSNLRSNMYMSFLRPLALPRAATLSRFLSTAAETTTSSTTQAELPVAESTPEALAAKPVSIPITPSKTLSYRVTRTPSKQLPIYLLAKRGGNLKQTRIKHIEGNINKLRDEMKKVLKIEEDKDITINQLTKHIIVKVRLAVGVPLGFTLTIAQGHRKPEVAKFLESKQF